METKILDILKKIFELEFVSKDISQANCDKWDSMSHLNLVIELESNFDIYLEPEEIAKMKSYAEIVRVVSTKL